MADAGGVVGLLRYLAHAFLCDATCVSFLAVCFIIALFLLYAIDAAFRADCIFHSFSNAMPFPCAMTAL